MASRIVADPSFKTIRPVRSKMAISPSTALLLQNSPLPPEKFRVQTGSPRIVVSIAKRRLAIWDMSYLGHVVFGTCRIWDDRYLLKQITVHGARQHNLKNIDVATLRNTLTVIMGLSGSGKSSLAFDTIYAEGQRRYVERCRLTRGSSWIKWSDRRWIQSTD